MRSAKVQLQFDPKLSRQTTRQPNPIVPGDHPDPTILRMGRTFWASATSGEWSPQFPLYRSNDLEQWRPAGSIFPQQPAWAEGSFWAPELVHDELTDRCLVWYVGKQRGGPLSIAVATAPSPGGPYTDHGPLIADPDGSIDPCFARDEHGAPFLIWKEDGNSAGRPTPIWAQPLTGDLLRLTGERTLLITNDQPWEEGVVEGPYILKHDGRFYLFYAGNSCCGRACKYAEGVARADRLLGPWEKFQGNPLIGDNDSWRCPGHGTAVRTSTHRGQPAQDYLLYHAYPAGGTIYVGREAILDEIAWRDGWPEINQGTGPGQPVSTPSLGFVDHFKARALGPSWQWPVNTTPDVTCGRGGLRLQIPWESRLSPRPVESAMIAVPRPAAMHYQATVSLTVPQTPNVELWCGLAIVGDPFNTIGLGLRGTELVLWERRGARQGVVWSGPAPATGRLYLRATSVDAEHRLQFAASVDGQEWQPAGQPYDGADLPAWDRGLRIALLLEGPLGCSANFRDFELRGIS